jgi:hypothetical protein
MAKATCDTTCIFSFGVMLKDSLADTERALFTDHTGRSCSRVLENVLYHPSPWLHELVVQLFKPSQNKRRVAILYRKPRLPHAFLALDQARAGPAVTPDHVDIS